MSSFVKASYFIVTNENSAEDIDSALFTHLFCAFAGIDSQTYKVTIPSDKFRSFTETVKHRNKDVKTLLSIGGDKSDFPPMASSPESRKSFIDSSIETARSLGFHGLELDWEYPNTVEEMTNYELLLKEWRAAVKAKKAPLLLTATVFYSPVFKSLPYPVQTIAENLDWVNIKA